MRDLVELVEAVDLVVGRARGVIDPDLHLDVIEQANSLRNRRGFFGESLVLAIAGGTGSGKSSLLNAIAGAPVASVSHLRPHTDEPLAWLPDDAEPGLRLLIDDMEISRRVTQGRMPGLALIDLPDMDSIADWHRHTVEDLLPKVDGVIWLFDPEKYHDRVLHADFLSHLAMYRDQFIFVLNKVDRIPEDEVDKVLAHLSQILAGDGYGSAAPFAVAADPEHGLPRGVEAFAAHLSGQLDAKRLATGKLIADAEHLMRGLGGATGLWEGGGVSFGERWARVRTHAAGELSKGLGASAHEDALCQIEDLVASFAVEVGDDFGDFMRRRINRQHIELAVAAAAESVPASRPPPRRVWFWRRRMSENGSPPEAAAVLEDRIGQPMRSLLWDRARLGATIAYAAVGARQLRDRLG